MRRVARYLLLFVLWNLVLSLAVLLLPPLVGVVMGLGIAGVFLFGVLLAPERGSRARRWATLRLRPISEPCLPWVALAIPVLLLLSYALMRVYLAVVPVPPETLSPFEQILRTREGRLAIAVLAVAIAPILEEFVFRGLIQRTLERRWGLLPGLAGAAFLFALVHLLPWVLPLHFFLGMAFGFAVWATRSIWAGVVLHAANNGAAMVGVGVGLEEPDPVPTIWETGITLEFLGAVATLMVSIVLAVWVARGMLRAGHSARLRENAALR